MAYPDVLAYLNGSGKTIDDVVAEAAKGAWLKEDLELAMRILELRLLERKAVQ